MIVLALDAGLAPFSVALDCAGAVTADRSERNDALETGLARIAGLLDGAGIALRDVDRVAVGIGPGSFTGVRIALSFAKALAYGAGLPLVGISSYDVLIGDDSRRPCLAIVSGRPGIVCARLSADGGERTGCGPVADVVERILAGLAPDSPLVFVANTEDANRAIGERQLNVTRLVSPPAWSPAAAIARLARDRHPAHSLHGLAPDYGEMPAVTLPKAGTNLIP